MLTRAPPTAAPPGPAPAPALSARSPTAQSLMSAYSDAVEADAAVAFLQIVHAAFPTAHLMEMRERLVGRRSLPLANRVFHEDVYGAAFRRGRAAFVEQTLDAAAQLRLPSHGDALDFSAGAKYTGRELAELEADCIVKLPLNELTEWTRDASAIAEGGARLLFIAPAGSGQRLPESAAPAALRASGAGGSRFSVDHYPAGAAAYVLAEVYAPVGECAVQHQVQRLLHAERLLQFLVAKEGTANVRDVVLGCVFMGLHTDAAAAAQLYATLSHYRRALPCLWALQGGHVSAAEEAQDAPTVSSPCRLLAFRLTSFAPAIVNLRVAALMEVVKEMKKELVARERERLEQKPRGFALEWPSFLRRIMVLFQSSSRRTLLACAIAASTHEAACDARRPV